MARKKVKRRVRELAAPKDLGPRARAALARSSMTMLELSKKLDMSRQGLYFAMVGERRGKCRMRLEAWLYAMENR